MWKSKRGLTDELVIGHVCSGNTCLYTKIGDVFICEKTGRVHVCDDTCREVVLDQSSGTLVCTISGHCFDSWLSPDEEADNDAVCIFQLLPSPPWISYSLYLSIFITKLPLTPNCILLSDLSIMYYFQDQQQAGVTDEVEPFMGSGRFGTVLVFNTYFLFTTLLLCKISAYLFIIF